MRDKGQLWLGGVLIFLGVLIMLDNLFGIRFGSLFWPLVFILVGVLIIVRPRMVGPDTEVGVRLFGDVRNMGEWDVRDAEYWCFIGDVKLDMREANIPDGVTNLKMYGFITDLKMRVPQDLAVNIGNVGFITESRLFGERVGGFLTPINWKSDNYDSAKQKLNIEMVNFIGGVTLIRN
jgi:predicted membrane protein